MIRSNPNMRLPEALSLMGKGIVSHTARQADMKDDSRGKAAAP